jgi:hypothetical protein
MPEPCRCYARSRHNNRLNLAEREKKKKIVLRGPMAVFACRHGADASRSMISCGWLIDRVNDIPGSMWPNIYALLTGLFHQDQRNSVGRLRESGWNRNHTDQSLWRKRSVTWSDSWKKYPDSLQFPLFFSPLPELICQSRVTKTWCINVTNRDWCRKWNWTLKKKKCNSYRSIERSSVRK